MFFKLNFDKSKQTGFVIAKMLKKSYSQPKGFSLIELLGALLIFALLSVMLLQTLTYSYFLNVANRNLTIAITHAQYVMEEIKSTNFDNIKSKVDSKDWDWSSATISQKGLTPLSNEAINTDELTVGSNNLLKVTVTVTWTDKTGRNRSTVLETYFTKPPS